MSADHLSYYQDAVATEATWAPRGSASQCDGTPGWWTTSCTTASMRGVWVRARRSRGHGAEALCSRPHALLTNVDAGTRWCRRRLGRGARPRALSVRDAAPPRACAPHTRNVLLHLGRRALLPAQGSLRATLKNEDHQLQHLHSWRGAGLEELTRSRPPAWARRRPEPPPGRSPEPGGAYPDPPDDTPSRDRVACR